MATHTTLTAHASIQQSLKRLQGRLVQRWVDLIAADPDPERVRVRLKLETDVLLCVLAEAVAHDERVPEWERLIAAQALCPDEPRMDA